MYVIKHEILVKMDEWSELSIYPRDWANTKFESFCRNVYANKCIFSSF